ncbi:MAG TPA: ABC transporter ATP-binding protein [Ferruginibacter sp.]|jgi:peptide/nickel transport system ATP-binding protein|nr:ABC transporter ATP-binding protein [Ferruginibacter sp.]
MSTPLLQITNLSIGFITDGVVSNAVKNSSFTVEKGEIVAIVGESGSGKSATALSLMQLLPATATTRGEILFSTDKGIVNILQLSAKEINTIRGKDIAMIFQEPMTSLNPVFTCGNQVMEAIQLHEKISSAKARGKTITLFEKVKLPDPKNIFGRYPHQLSGGQKQRVMIAMAMSCNPSLLIADEPTTALDVTVQQTIILLIKELQQQNNMGVVFISHDIGLVAAIADKVLVMYKGEIVEQGKTETILKTPQHPYTKALLACRPTMHAKGERLPVVSDFLSDEPTAKTALSPNTSYIASCTSYIEAPVLSVKNLSVHFPEKKKLFAKNKEPLKAVDEVSFDVFKGETIGLVGESGCGKTTLGRTILQLLPATSGSIILDDVDLTQLSKKEMRPLRKDLQIIFQDPYGSLNPRLTIGDAIKEPMQVHQLFSTKEQYNKVIELLEKVNLKPEHFKRYPHEFSGGQRQRICIARALALNPSFLIFDESVSALDVSVQAQVLNLLNDLKREFNFTSIFISHDLSVVHYISDRIMVMNKGKIIETGNADDVFFSPQNEYTQKLIAAIPGK